MVTTPDLRIHLPQDGPTAPRPGGEFVLYWMQTTHRAHDNFALNVAIEQANQLRLPVLVYHGLRHDYPWASDRFHTWILESVVDLYADFAAKGIQYAFWLGREKGSFTEWPAGRREMESGAGQARGPAPTPLVALATRAAIVVTDYFPTFIAPRQTRGLRLKTKTPVIAVESCTVVPLRQIEKAHSTARGIRPVLMSALEHYLYPVPNPEPKVRRQIELPFGPVVPTGATIPALVAACDIDHSVAPSRSFRGGTRAGRARLKAFLKTGLARYEERNDPNEPDAVSRLSPWLHFGNLSIHEVVLGVRARVGAELQLRPCNVFLDQAVVWRELAFNFCHYDPKHRTVNAIPGWARKQLADHESDPRPHLYSMQEMEQARTGEELWNAAQ
ncbi:MAG: deoxyribodipyrimidine photo-lyase, partial [Gemmatimonadota bacterium]|nr:deoxyribodipyrimidine photo-lyase [Gemmatimonadota bacterium]